MVLCMYVCAVRAKEAVGITYSFTFLRKTSRGNNPCSGLYPGHWQAVDPGFFCPVLQKPQQHCHVLVVPSTSGDRRYLQSKDSMKPFPTGLRHRCSVWCHLKHCPTSDFKANNGKINSPQPTADLEALPSVFTA